MSAFTSSLHCLKKVTGIDLNLTVKPELSVQILCAPLPKKKSVHPLIEILHIKLK